MAFLINFFIGGVAALAESTSRQAGRARPTSETLRRSRAPSARSLFLPTRLSGRCIPVTPVPGRDLCCRPCMPVRRAASVEGVGGASAGGAGGVL